MNELHQQILFDKYAIEECLKKDDFNAVYIADHIYLQKKIILKVLNTHEIPERSILERFKREAKLLARLEHPNLIKVLDFGNHDKFFYISFEYFKSKNLRAVIRQNELSVEQKIDLMRQLLLAVDYIHENAIIHRDLKPENILVSDSLVLKVGDFGLAIGTNDEYVTSKDSIVGTPCYMSPEQVRGDALTEKSDLFSLGIVLYELFTGGNPFLGKDINATFNNIVAFNEKDEKTLNGEIPPDADKVIRELLKCVPAQRRNIVNDIFDDTSGKEKQKETPRKVKTRTLVSVLGLLSFLFIVVITGYLISKNLWQKTTPTPTTSVDQEKKTVSTDSASVKKPLPESDAIISGSETVKDANDPATAKLRQKTAVELSNSNQALGRSGKLFVECQPWAYVYIDSVLLETTPLKSDLSLPAGQHVIRLLHPNYPLFTKRIQIQESQTLTLRANLDTLFGYLDCKINPWGEILVDGKLMGETPLQSALKIFPGEHTVTLRNSNFPAAEYRVKIEQNKVFTLKHSFRNGN